MVVRALELAKEANAAPLIQSERTSGRRTRRRMSLRLDSVVGAKHLVKDLGKEVAKRAAPGERKRKDQERMQEVVVVSGDEQHVWYR